jgi:hypothetical protein
VKCHILSIVLYGAETWTLRKVDQKYRQSFEMCWRRMEKISWTEPLKNEEVLQIVMEERDRLSGAISTTVVRNTTKTRPCA